MALGHGVAKKVQTTGLSTTLANAWTVSAGSLLVCVLTSWTGNATEHVVSSGNNGTWTRIATANGASAKVSLHYAKNATAGLESLTINSGGAGNYLTGIFHEVTGADTTAPFTAGEVASGTHATGTNPQTGSVTNATANSIFFAGLCTDTASGTATLTVDSTGSSPTGWALQDATESQHTNANAYTTLSVPHLIVSSGAATKHGWTTNSIASAHVIAAFKAASTGTTLTVAGSDHAQTVAEPALTQAHTLTVAGASHAQSVEAPVLTQAHTLAVDGATQASAVDAVALTQAHTLAVAAAAQAQTADNVALGVPAILEMADAAHEQTVDAPTILVLYLLEVQGAAHGQTADAIALAQAHVLALANASHAQTSESPALTQAQLLVVAGAMQAQTVSSPLVYQPIPAGRTGVTVTDSRRLSTAGDSRRSGTPIDDGQREVG